MGMDPNLVLQGEECKKFTFNKRKNREPVIKTKDCLFIRSKSNALLLIQETPNHGEAASQGSVDTDPESVSSMNEQSDDTTSVTQESAASTQLLQKYSTFPVSGSHFQEPQCEVIERPKSTELVTTLHRPKYDHEIAKISDMISGNFILATAEIVIDESIIENLINGHSLPDLWNKCHTDSVLHILGITREVVMKFAARSRIFQSLNVNDQQTLLEKNGNLYLQYVVGKFLAARTGFDQISVLLGPLTPLESRCHQF